MAVVTTRIPNELFRQIRRIEQEEKADRSEVLRRLLDRAVKEWRLERALQALREGKTSLRTAAKFAGLTYVEMMEEAERARIEVGYGLDELRTDLETIVKAA